LLIGRGTLRCCASSPFAPPLRAPAEGTISIGAFCLLVYPDLIRLLDDDSLRVVRESFNLTRHTEPIET
jgi:hypothetical protein